MKHLTCILAFSSLLGAMAANAQNTMANATMGSPAPVEEAERSITVASDARWVNVKRGETVRFVVGSAQFAWKFDGWNARPFDLRAIAPAGALANAVTVYVAPAVGHPP